MQAMHPVGFPFHQFNVTTVAMDTGRCHGSLFDDISHYLTGFKHSPNS